MKNFLLPFAVTLLFSANTISAQVLKISAYGQEAIVMGDITNKEINSPSAGYVDYGSTSGLEINYYFKNNLGLGIRWSGTFYEQDTDAYEEDLTKMLGILNDQYDVSESFGIWTIGSDLGISYLVNMNQKLQLEPYFYFGFLALASPENSAIYLKDNTTFQYNSRSQMYFGIGYSPGVKLNWNAFKKLGLYFSLEYSGNSFLKDDERSMVYSYNTLDITETEKSYNIQSVNIGIGLSYRFGKGLSD
jgi:hypothetical protein